jgi:hypothetical protein
MLSLFLSYLDLSLLLLLRQYVRQIILFIDLIDEKPFKQRYRRIPQAAYDDVRAHLRQLLNAGIIQPSRSLWASNVVLVRKKDNITKKDSYALPRIEELLDCLGGSTIFYHHLILRRCRYTT